MGVLRLFYGYSILLGVAAWLLVGCAGDGLSATPGADAVRVTADVTLEQTLEDLDALVAPTGTDARLFGQLKAELGRSLAATGAARFTAAAPQSAASSVSDLAITANPDGSASFSFCYCNAGDYNQDGLVYISDLSAIGQQWDKNTQSPDWSTALLVDGNTDGRITLSDITPIGQNYLAMVKGYALYSSTTFTGFAEGTEVTRIALASGVAPDGGGRLVFSFTIDAPVADCYYAVRPYADESTGIASNAVRYVPPSPVINGVSPVNGRTGTTVTLGATVQGGTPDTYAWDFGGAGAPETSTDTAPELILGDAGTYQASLTVGNAFGTDTFDFSFNVNANQPPVASLTAAVTTGPAPLAVTLNAAGSRDDDGSITGYEWDWTSNGSWDLDTGAVPTAQHTYDSDGTYIAMVRVTDDSGATNTATLTITVTKSGAWNLLIWMAADNNLAQAAYDDITEMEQVGSTDQVRILVGYDIDPEWCDPGLAGLDQVRFIKVVQDFNPNSINVSGDAANMSFPRAGYNSADPAKLTAFLNWAETNFPAPRTALVLWDHGSGWRVGDAGGGSGAGRRQRGRQASGVLGDDTDGDWDLTSNAAVINAIGSRTFDMLAFDACNMADIESLYEYRTVASWIVASEATVPNDGLDYKAALQEWNNQLPDACGVGQIFVDKYFAYYNLKEEAQLAVLDASLIPPAVTALGNFAAAVEAKSEAESAHVESALMSAYDTWGDGTRDVVGFLTSFKALTTDSALKGLADGAITACNNLVVHTAQFNMAGNNGLAVFLPDEWWWDNSLIAEYDGLAFDQATGWLDMLRATVGYETSPVYNWTPGDHVRISWPDFKAGIDQGIVDPHGNLGYNWDPLLVAQSIYFGLDDLEMGIPEEYAELKVGAFTGDYTITIWWWYYDTYFAPPFMPVHMRIYDSNWDLKQDLGTFDIGYQEERAVVILRN